MSTFLFQLLQLLDYFNFFFYSSLVGNPIRLTSSAIRLKICAITAGIKRYKSTIKRKKNKHNKIVFLGQISSNSKEVLISKAVIDSNISHDEFVLRNNVLKKYDDMKKEINNLKTS